MEKNSAAPKAAFLVVIIGLAGAAAGLALTKLTIPAIVCGGLAVCVFILFLVTRRRPVESAPATAVGVPVAPVEQAGPLPDVLTEYVLRRTAADSLDPHADDEAGESLLLAELEEKHSLPASSLSAQLANFAKKLVADRQASAYQRAQAAFARKDYARAESLALEIVPKGEEALPIQRREVLQAHELAAWSARLAGDPDKAHAHFTAAAGLADKAVDPLEWARVHHAQASLLHAHGDSATAEELLRQAHFLRHASLGPHHPDTLATRNTLAQTLAAQGKHGEAEDEHKAILQLSEQHLGSEHPATMASHNHLANVLFAQGKYLDAEREHRAVFLRREYVCGPEHPDTLNSRSNLANALAAQDKFVEAETEHRAILKLRERVLGPEHPDRFSTLYNLAICLQMQGNLKEARELAHRAASGGRKALGADHPDTKEYEALSERLEPR